MKTPVCIGLVTVLSIAVAEGAVDDFNLQMTKAMHEVTSWNHDVYTVGKSAGYFESECPWFQKPGVTLRFQATYQERAGGAFRPMETDELYRPMVDFHFQTYGGVDVGIAYAHGFLERSPSFPLALMEEGDMDSVGGYFGKQFNCGMKLGATWSYSTADLRLKDFDRSFHEFDTVGASGAIGYARSFGDRTSWRNAFVDTSANFLYQSEEEQDGWYFLWMAKVGHNCCERFAFYGIFNLFHQIEREGPAFLIGYAGYHPVGDETWGETGAGFQAQLGRGFSLTAEATTPVLDEGNVACNAFQVRSGVNWSF